MSWNKAFNRHTSRALFMVMGLAAILVAFSVDNMVDAAVLLPADTATWRIAWWISKLGDWPVILLVWLAGVAVLACRRKWASVRLLSLILVAGLLTGFACTVIRATVGRTRPTAKVPQGFYGIWYQGKWIAGKYQFSSFPSGHTATWAGLAGAAWLCRRRLVIAFLAIAGVVAWSRMALGCHHFSDVTGAMILGLMIGGWLCRWLGGILEGNSDRNYDAATSA